VEIEEEGSAYWVSVVSKVNPVTVKGRRYGPAARLALQSGESFEIAKYEVQVLLPQPAPVAVSRPQAAPVPAQVDDAARLFNESTFFGEDVAPTGKPVAYQPAPPEETFVPHKAALPTAPSPALAQHGELARAAGEDFNKAFGRDFMTAYHAHLRRLKGGR
jgi:predicted component of type VI protein secretion system